MVNLTGNAKQEGAAGKISPLFFAWIGSAALFGALAIWSQWTYEPDASSNEMPAGPAEAGRENDLSAGSAPEGPGTSATPETVDQQPAPGPTGGAASDAVSGAATFPDTADAPSEPATDASGPAESRGGLVPAPDPDLVENGPAGFLPIISADGRAPWQVYGRPFAADPNWPRIAIVITGLGLSEAMTRTATDALPGEITFAFSPYASSLQERVEQARSDGHEALLMLPMEPMDYPANDPGPLTLLVESSERANRDRLYRLLGSFSGYVGVVNHMGSRFTASATAMTPLAQELVRRGLMMVDARSTRFTVASDVTRNAGVPVAYNNRFIDNDASAEEIRRHLLELENVAETVGSAVGIGRPYPVTIRELVTWASRLADKEIALAPVTAIANRQPAR